jgi:hypothetical protein
MHTIKKIAAVVGLLAIVAVIAWIDHLPRGIVPSPSNNEGYMHVIAELSHNLFIPSKYRCGSYSISPPPSVYSTPSAVILYPPRVTILNAAGDDNSASHYDVAFSTDCARVYHINGSGDAVNTIYITEVPSGKTSNITIPNSAFPKDMLMLGLDGTVTAPFLDFIYAIDQSHLLLSFENPTTGVDVFTNQSSQAEYDLRTKELRILSGGEVSGGEGTAFLTKPVLLNYQTNTLILGGLRNSQGMLLSRTEFALPSGASTTILLASPYTFQAIGLCGMDADPSSAEYEKCAHQSLQPFLQ